MALRASEMSAEERLWAIRRQIGKQKDLLERLYSAERKLVNEIADRRDSLKSSPKRLQTKGFAPLPGAKDTESP